MNRPLIHSRSLLLTSLIVIEVLRRIVGSRVDRETPFLYSDRNRRARPRRRTDRVVRDFSRRASINKPGRRDRERENPSYARIQNGTRRLRTFPRRPSFQTRANTEVAHPLRSPPVCASHLARLRRNPLPQHRRDQRVSSRLSLLRRRCNSNQTTRSTIGREGYILAKLAPVVIACKRPRVR